MLEKDLVKSILQYLRSVPHCFCWKVHGGMYGVAGLPDVVCCIRGKFVCFEVKLPKKKPTVLQQKTIEKIIEAGGTAHVVHSVDDVRALVENLCFAPKKEKIITLQ
jgi:Holliday junction resolvase